MHPPGAVFSEIYGTDGNQHVGHFMPTSSLFCAAPWTGTSNIPVDLHQAAWQGSRAWGVDDGQQVGDVFTPDGPQAVLWTGTAASAVMLHPAGASSSVAQAVKNGIQLGYAMIGLTVHAALWTGTAASFIDMHAGSNSVIMATNGTQHVGGITGSAAIWTGTSPSPVLLNPPGSRNSIAMGTNGTVQVGRWDTFDPLALASRAAAWRGTASSFVDLHSFLPPGQFEYSEARAISADGTIAGYAVNYTTGDFAAVIWKSTVFYTFEGFLSPINEPPAGESSFRKNSVIPVKFRLLDENGAVVTNEEAHISLTKLGAVETPVNEADFVMPADDGSRFRVSGDKFVYNLGTRNLEKSARYRLTATYGQGSHSATFVVS